MGSFQLNDAPEAGGLDAVSVPLLLAQAWRDRRTGRLELERDGQAALAVEFREGAPTAVATVRGEERFARFLEETGRLTGPQRAKVERFAEERECPEASAVLALQHLDAKALYQALRDHQRGRLAESFAWAGGQYRWLAGTTDAEDDPARKAKPFDVLSLLQRELPRRWGTDRLFSELMAVQDARGDVSPRFRKIAQKLAREGAAAQRAMTQLDGRSEIGRILGTCAGEPLAAATLWTALQAGVVRLGGGVSMPTDAPLEFEVEVRDAPSAARATADRPAREGKAAKNAAKGEALREEIGQLLGQLGALDHYSALGLDESASAADIKKSYFKAAKRYHPDALARLGVDDLKQEAAQVFARIAEAFETLSDPEKKRVYDAGGSDEPEIDTARLAQAETSFRKGEILAKMGNFEGALEYLEPAVELWPQEPAYQALLGWALYRQPKTDAARAAEHLELAAAAAPDDALIHFRLGLALRATGDADRAQAMIARARSIDPDVEE